MAKKKENKAKEKYNELTQKLQKIFDIYTNSNAKLWILDTDIYNMWDRFADNLQLALVSKNSEKLPKTISISSVKSNKNNKRYSLLANGTNVTPIRTKGNKVAAKSTIQQYLKVGSALSYINYSDKDKIDDNISYSLNPKIVNLFINKEKELDNAFLRSLTNSLTSEDPNVVNIGYSLLVTLMYKTDKHLFYDIKNHKISTRKSGNDNVIEYSDYDIGTIPAIEIIRHVAGEKEGPNKEIKGSSSTYKVAAEKLLDKYDLYGIVDYMFEKISTNKDIGELEVKTKDRDNEFKKSQKIAEAKIQKARSHLRKNIISARVSNENEPYTDLENSKLNEDIPSRLVACHICDVSKIIDEFNTIYTKSDKDTPLEYFIKQASDPNNGILLSPSAHVLFDNQTIWFDSEGKLCYKMGLIRTVKNAFGEDLDHVRIKPSVLTPEMIEYINKKW